MVSRNSAFGLKCSFERQQDQWDQVASPGPMQMTQPAVPIGQVDGSVNLLSNTNLGFWLRPTTGTKHNRRPAS
jgi:hypothetical protein